MRLIERISSTPGMPFIAVSIGKVRYCSTSSGDSPGALVRIDDLRVGDVGDGVDRQLAQRRPARRAKTAAQIASTTPRRRTDELDDALRGSSQQLALEQEGAVDGDQLARRRAPAGSRPDRRPTCPSQHDAPLEARRRSARTRRSCPRPARPRCAARPAPRRVASCRIGEDARGDQLARRAACPFGLSNSRRTFAVRVASSMTGTMKATRPRNSLARAARRSRSSTSWPTCTRARSFS